MNFQDVVDKNKEQLIILTELEDFVNKVIEAKEQCIAMHEFLFSNCMQNLKTNGDLCNSINSSYNYLRERLIVIDGYELKDVITRINNIYTNEVIENNLRVIEEGYKEVVRIRSIIDLKEKVKNYMNCIDALEKIITRYNELKMALSYTSAISDSLNLNYAKSTLSIRSNVNKIDSRTFDAIESPIMNMYEQICMLANVSMEEYPLNIVRVESGCITINFDGLEPICKVIEKVLSGFNNFFVRYFTREGKKINLAESVDLLMKEIDIINAMQEAGLDTAELKDIQRETAINIFKQAHKFLEANPDVKINKKVINRAKEISELLSEPKYLSDGEDKKAIE